MGLQFLQDPIPAWTLHGITASFKVHPPDPTWSPSRATEWISAPLLISMGYRGTICITIVFTMGCRGISALAPGAHPPPLSSLTLVSAGLFLAYTHFSLLDAVVQQFLPLLKHVTTEMLPVPLMDSALASCRSFLEPAGTGFVQHSGSL